MASAGLPELVAKQASMPPPLTNDHKMQWNAFLDYLKQRGVQGSPMLDNRDTGLGQKLMEEYRAQNPHFTLTYDQVPAIQQNLQDYRQGLIQKWKANPATAPGVKSPDEIMGGISPVDGWLGSKTSSYKFPTAQFNDQNFGVNTNAYDAQVAAAVAKLKKQ